MLEFPVGGTFLQTQPSVQHPELVLLAALAGVLLLLAFGYLRRNPLVRWVTRLSDWFTSAPRLQPLPGTSFAWPLFLASFATLYVEIMMIRWIGTEVRIFAYMQNLALICCFLGFGLGCYWAERGKNILNSLASVSALVALVLAPIPTWQMFLVHLSNQLSISPDAAQWGSLYAHPKATLTLFVIASILAVAVFLLLLVLAMVPLGQWVGHFLDAAPNPIQAYTINLLGSLAGMWVFASFSFFGLSVGYWFALGFVVILFIQPSLRLAVAAAILLSLSLVLIHGVGLVPPQTYWSPYQKLVLTSLGDQQYRIDVNNTGYMSIYNLTSEFLARNPSLDARFRDESSYDAPFRFAASRDRVLIVGAGAGNDAAAALRNGAKQVDAVEIDPVIYELGKRLHPEHPYDSPNVRVILNDARAYLRRATPGYDVILFGLLDSHTQFSDYSNMRIDNYVYTEESFREARHLLSPTGVLIVKFEVREPWTWMGRRFYAALTGVFNRAPVVFRAPPIGALTSATVFIDSDDPGLWARASDPDLASLVSRHPPNFELTATDAPLTPTDDWPYLYHRSRSIPRTYLIVSAILLLMTVVLAGKTLEMRHGSTWYFFLLGAGFLLLETQMVSRLALYFGTTWRVNCFVLSGILAVLVLANFAVARRRPSGLLPHYLALIASLVAIYFFPWQGLSYSARGVGTLLGLAYLIPIFLAGIIFTESFRRTPRKAAAFGANIVGAVAGGLAQNVSFIVGMNALLILAALFYAAAVLVTTLGQKATLSAT